MDPGNHTGGSARGWLVFVLVAGAVLLLASVAAAAGRFDDDDGNVHESDIDEIAAQAVTQGCNPPRNNLYCPDLSVTRGQMAAFLRRALGLPLTGGDPFRDDDASLFEADIEALAAVGIARGCNPPANDRFCPDDAVTRDEMAAFLVRAFGLAGDLHDVFADDDGSVFEGDIDRLASAGVTFGCNPPDNSLYCPEAEVQRDQMASFLVRAIAQMPVVEQFSFTAGGDIGADEDTTDFVMDAMAERKGDFFLALGDLSYDDVVPETAWCDYVKSYLGEEHPVQVVVGNHEDQDREDGFIRNFARCLPDRMDSVGDYGVQYYFDMGDLARVIMLPAREDVDGVDYDYFDGTRHMAWLDEALAGARDKQWVIVGMHRPCLSAGQKDCEIGTDLMDRLIEAEVDLVLQAHDHTYQRSKQLRCGEEDSYVASCVSDDGSDGVYPAGEGTVFVIAGNMGGGDLYEIDPEDPEYPYFVTTLGAGHPQAGFGFTAVDVSTQSIEVEFVGGTTSFTDSFSIR